MEVAGGSTGTRVRYCSLFSQHFNQSLSFYSCAESNLNGKYYPENPRAHKSTGILWESWLGDYSLKTSIIMIRPKDTWNRDEESSAAEAPQDP